MAVSAIVQLPWPWGLHLHTPGVGRRLLAARQCLDFGPARSASGGQVRVPNVAQEDRSVDVLLSAAKAGGTELLWRALDRAGCFTFRTVDACS